MSQRKLNKEAKEEDIEKFKKLYNPGVSSRENAKVMSASGLSISKNTVKSWAAKYYNNIVETENSCNPEPESDFNFFQLPEFNWNIF